MADPKTILITGASSGIGLDSAIALAKRGHKVIATAQSDVRVATILDEAKRNNVTLEAFKLDITDHVDRGRIKALVIDILINNAGIGESGPLIEIPLERVQHNFEVNVFGTLAMCQAVAPGMIARGSGRIINVSSIAGRVVAPFLAPYCMTKWSIEAMSDGLRIELEPKGIKVAIIEPGLIQTGFNQRMAETKYSWLSNETSSYKDQIEAMKKHDSRLADNAATTTPVVAVMIEAVESLKPKTRYVAPKRYRSMLFWLKWTSDRTQDRIMRG